MYSKKDRDFDKTYVKNAKVEVGKVLNELYNSHAMYSDLDCF